MTTLKPKAPKPEIGEYEYDDYSRLLFYVGIIVMNTVALVGLISFVLAKYVCK